MKVGFKKNGKVMALDVTYYSNAGNSMDLSLSVSIRGMALMLSNISTYFINQSSCNYLYVISLNLNVVGSSITEYFLLSFRL